MHHMAFRYQLQQQDESHCQRIHEQLHAVSTNRHRIHQAVELQICYQLCSNVLQSLVPVSSPF